MTTTPFRLPFEIGWRYLRAGRSGRRNGFVSFLSLVAIAGIALGVAALVVVLSVVSGFQKEVRDRMLAVVPQVELQDAGGRPLADWRQLAEAAARDPAVRAAAPFVALAGIVARGDEMRAVALRGVLPAEEARVTPLAASLTGLEPGGRRIVLGRELARMLRAGPGDRVTLLQPGADGAAVPRFEPFTVAGTFASGHFELDATLAMVALDDAAALLGRPGPTGVRLALDDPLAAPRVADALAAALGPSVFVSDWTRVHRAWFESVAIQKRMLALILGLIVAVAAFNLVSTLVMGVTDKRADIAILRTLGLGPRGVMAIFVVQGSASGLFGTIAGAAGGLLVALELHRIVPLIERLVGRALLDPSVYLLDRIPSDPQPGDIVPVVVVSLALALVATLYPSWRASRVEPAQVLRGE